MPCLFGDIDQIEQITVIITERVFDAVVIQTELRKMDGFSGTVIQPQNAEYCVVAFGIAARISKNAVVAARKKGIKAGLCRYPTML